jgi:hypothetical protein
MADYDVQRIDEIEAMFAGGMRRARSALGVTSFGMQVLELPANLEPGPEGMRVLALGGTPGEAYDVRDFTEVGAPDPFAR